MQPIRRQHLPRRQDLLVQPPAHHFVTADDQHLHVLADRAQRVTVEIRALIVVELQAKLRLHQHHVDARRADQLYPSDCLPHETVERHSAQWVVAASLPYDEIRVLRYYAWQATDHVIGVFAADAAVQHEDRVASLQQAGQVDLQAARVAGGWGTRTDTLGRGGAERDDAERRARGEAVGDARERKRPRLGRLGLEARGDDQHEAE
jgi:hypothetical protein